MPKEDLREIEAMLADLPPGKLLVRTHTSEHESPFCLEDISAGIEGKAMMESWSIFPGVSLTHGLFVGGRCAFLHPPHGTVVQINHCRRGRCGWDMPGEVRIYLGPGDLSVHTLDLCTDAAMNFPLGFYEGISIILDFGMLERDMPPLLQEAGITGKAFRERFCVAGGYTAVSASPQIEHIFSELYTLPPQLQIPYFKLKVQELLLFFSTLKVKKGSRLDPLHIRQVETIRSVHNQLTGHPEQRFTIQQLSRQYLMNETTLKAVFKSVYGAPIAAYMKEYRIQQAARMLRETDHSILEIAQQVGYDNQGKFAAAFRSVLHLPPTEYRRQNCGQRAQEVRH